VTGRWEIVADGIAPRPARMRGRHHPRPLPVPETPRAVGDLASERSWPLAGGLVAVGLWGLAPVATRAAVTHLAPVPLLALRLTVAALVLAP
jgi:hypothetical protein